WIFIFFVWYYLIKIAHPQKLKILPGGKELIESEKKKLGSASFEEKSVFIIFVLAAIAWITRSFLLQEFVSEHINDAIIAMTFGAVLFIIPAKNKQGDFLLDWNTAVKLPWGIL